MSCVVCTTTKINVLCPSCKNGVCMICFTKIKCCPFCRAESFGLLDREIEELGSDSDSESESESEYDEEEDEVTEAEAASEDRVLELQNIINKQVERDLIILEHITSEKRLAELRIQESIIREKRMLQQQFFQERLMNYVLEHGKTLDLQISAMDSDFKFD